MDNLPSVAAVWFDLSIPLRFGGPQPNAYGVEPADSNPVKAGSLVGDTRRGGSCNFEQYTFIPHCSGTHTECVGHITHARISVRECLRDVLMTAALVTVEPMPASEIDETYAVELGIEDRLITKRAIESALESIPRCRFNSALPPADAGGSDLLNGVSALIVRTLPNDDSKLTRVYFEGNMPPFFTTEAMQFIVASGFRHLLVDIPSIDRIYDEGKLINHRIFWNIAEGNFDVNSETRIHSTITELIYVPNKVADGEYLLNLQIAPFDSDAAPSRPVILQNHF